jgi:hypothetical protein
MSNEWVLYAAGLYMKMGNINCNLAVKPKAKTVFWRV